MFAETSKNMLPCQRCVHLHKLASFEMVFGKIENKNWCKMDPRLSTNQFKKHPKQLYENKSNNINPNTPNIQISAPLLEPIASHFPRWRVVFATCFSEPLGVAPWTDFGRPWGTLGPMASTCWKISVANLLQHFRDSRATNGTDHTFKKTSKDSNELYR